MLKVLPERYFKKQEVTDFVEYERDNFLVSVMNDTHFHLIKRPDKNKGSVIRSIRSLNKGYMTLGLQMMPQYEVQHAIIRDTRGI